MRLQAQLLIPKKRTVVLIPLSGCYMMPVEDEIYMLLVVYQFNVDKGIFSCPVDDLQ